MLRGLAPVVDAGCTTLILGSFPSPASLAAQQYYAHPQNHFWRLLGAILSTGIAPEFLQMLPYVERLNQVRRHGIGIWDIYQACEREGALDSAIRHGEMNDFPALLAGLPNLRRVCFNGQTAARVQRHFAALGLETALLPSSSPAYTLRFEEKLARWQAAMPYSSPVR